MVSSMPRSQQEASGTLLKSFPQAKSFTQLPLLTAFDKVETCEKLSRMVSQLNSLPYVHVTKYWSEP